LKSEQVFDLESQRVLLQDMNIRLKQSFQIEHQTLLKLEQTSSYKSKTNSTYQNTLMSGKHKRLTFLGILITIPILLVSVFSSDLNSSFVASDNDAMKSGYLIQNLRGDTAETWVSWNLTPNKSLTFTILGESLVSPEKISEIKDVVLSEKSLQIDNSLLHKGLKGTSSTYYVGWAGAMKQASQNPTKMVVPQNFEYVSSEKGAADITIKLVSQRSGDGYSGYTQSTVDKNQILKSTISIYNVEELSTSQITTIVRHEFGHAIGLAHTTATEELMAPTITTDYPYISPCTVHAIEKLYDGNQKSEVVCEI